MHDEKRSCAARQELVVYTSGELPVVVHPELWARRLKVDQRKCTHPVCKLETRVTGGDNRVCSAVVIFSYERLLSLAKCRFGLLSMHGVLGLMYCRGSRMVLRHWFAEGFCTGWCLLKKS